MNSDTCQFAERPRADPERVQQNGGRACHRRLCSAQYSAVTGSCREPQRITRAMETLHRLHTQWGGWKIKSRPAASGRRTTQESAMAWRTLRKGRQILRLPERRRNAGECESLAAGSCTGQATCTPGAVQTFMHPQHHRATGARRASQADAEATLAGRLPWHRECACQSRQQSLTTISSSVLLQTFSRSAAPSNWL